MSDSDPLLIRMDNLVDFIDSALHPIAKAATADRDDEKKMIDDTNKSAAPLSNSKYLDPSWTVNRKQQLSLLKSNGYSYRADKDVDKNIERPIGHTTHNLFLKDKKSNQRFLITHHQSHKVNYKALGKKLKQKGFKVKELRMDSPKNRQNNLNKCFGFRKGCITALSLLNIKDYNKETGVQWILDSKLMQSTDDLTICAGCADPTDHTQHHVVDISIQKLTELMQTIGVEPIVLDFN